MSETMETVLFIVARHRHDLYASLARTFEADDTARVILDRRVGERRQRHEPPVVEHRQGERRARPEVDAQLRSRGWAPISMSSGMRTTIVSRSDNSARDPKRAGGGVSSCGAFR